MEQEPTLRPQFYEVVSLSHKKCSPDKCIVASYIRVHRTLCVGFSVPSLGVAIAEWLLRLLQRFKSMASY